MTTDLVVDSVSRRFGNSPCLDRVSFSVTEGEVLGLLGANGAGKSTLLRILGGTLREDSGRILLGGRALSSNDRRAATAALFGNEVGLYNELTPFENIMFFIRLRRIDRKKALADLEMLAHQFRIEGYLHKKVHTLSKGMKQKVAIVRSIIHSPSVILFDEPDSGLDFTSVKIANHFLREQAAEGKAVILSSHSVGDILATCDRVAVLHEGCIARECSVQELIGSSTFEEAYRQILELV